MRVKVNQNVIVFSVSALFFLVSANLKSQKIKEFDYPDTREVRIIFKDSVVTANVMIIDKSIIKLKEERNYFWYHSNKIWSNEGAYDGQLLQGIYEVKDKEGRLIQRGHFNNGLKDGSWITWFLNGERASVVNWKMGEKHGESLNYFEDGTLSSLYIYKSGKKRGRYLIYNSKSTVIEKGKFKDGLKSGKIYTYDEVGTPIETLNYKNGALVEPKIERVKPDKLEKKDSTLERTKESDSNEQKKWLKFWKKKESTTETD